MMFIRFIALVCWMPLMYIDTYWVRSIFLKLVQWNGPLLIKLTQVYASVYDTKIECVYDNINVHHMRDTERLYHKDFGHTIYEDYDALSLLASGSIGQVYKAVDKKTGDTVAIKARHPGVYEQSMKQIVYFRYILNLMCRTMSVIDVNAIIDTYMCQLKFRTEAEHMTRFNENFKHTQFVKFPKPLKVSDNFIVMTHHDGMRKHDISNDEYTYSKVALMLFSATRMMFLDHGFLHCDLHQGNWAYCPNEKNLIIYDTGCSIETDVDLCSDLLHMVFLKEIRGAVRLFMERMLTTTIDSSNIDRWLRRNESYIKELSKKTDGKTILKLFVKCAHEHRTSIKKDMLYFLLSNVALDRVLYDNGCTGCTHEDSMFVLKSELGLVRGTDSIRYESFIRKCLKNDTPRDVDMMSVETFYNLKNN